MFPPTYMMIFFVLFFEIGFWIFREERREGGVQNYIIMIWLKASDYTF